MEYKVENLGENLYKVVMPWWYLGEERLILALLSIQKSGKTVTYVRKLWGWSDTYLVCTIDKV